MAAAQRVVPGLFVIPTGIVDTFLIDAPDDVLWSMLGCPAATSTFSAGSRRPAGGRPIFAI